MIIPKEEKNFIFVNYNMQKSDRAVAMQRSLFFVNMKREEKSIQNKGNVL